MDDDPAIVEPSSGIQGMAADAVRDEADATPRPNGRSIRCYWSTGGLLPFDYQLGRELYRPQ